MCCAGNFLFIGYLKYQSKVRASTYSETVAVYTAGPQVTYSMAGKKSREWFGEACTREIEEKERERGERVREREQREKRGKRTGKS